MNMNKKEKMYEVAAKIAVKYGGATSSLYTDRRIDEFWKGNKSPSPGYLNNITFMPYLKWFIHNKIKCENNIWNADFLQGLVTAGRIKWNVNTFPTFEWMRNNRLVILFESSLFGGKLNNVASNNDKRIKRWKHVAALYLPYSIKSISFMAGVLASGEIIEIKKNTYAKYNITQLEYFVQWGIPIENKKIKYFLVSPIWPAIFSLFMPECCKDYFIVKNAFNVRTYAPVLWYMYASKSFVSRGMPYLKSARQIYYDHHCEEGASRRLEMLRLSLGLINLDNRIKEAVKSWVKNKS